MGMRVFLSHITNCRGPTEELFPGAWGEGQGTAGEELGGKLKTTINHEALSHFINGLHEASSLGKGK